MRHEPQDNPSSDPLPTRVHRHEHPVDLPGDDESGHPLRWASGAIAAAALFLALTNASAIHGWATELPPSATAARLTDAAARWEAITGPLGAPRAAAHERWKRAQAARFGAERAAP